MGVHHHDKSCCALRGWQNNKYCYQVSSEKIFDIENTNIINNDTII